MGHGWWVLVIFRQGSSEAPDSGKAILRSRGRPKLPATAGQARLREEPPPADIFYPKKYSFSEFDVRGEDAFFGREYPPKGYFGLVGALAAEDTTGTWRNLAMPASSVVRHRHTSRKTSETRLLGRPGIYPRRCLSLRKGA